MATITLTLQNVNGDPFTSGGNINITTGTTAGAVFNESGLPLLSTVSAGDTVELGGLTYNYAYLGSHLVRGDPLQPAAYIRIVGPLPAGSTLTIGATYAIDLTGLPGDPDYPNLQNGNTRGNVASLDTTTPTTFPGVICFAEGTRILTPIGEVCVEDLVEGELVLTKDDGAQPIHWVGKTELSLPGSDEKDKPVLIKANAIKPGKPMRDLVVSPLHKLLLDDVEDFLACGASEVLVPAKGIVGFPGVRKMAGKRSVTYYHVMLERHSILFADGLETESFYPGRTALSLLTAEQRSQINNLTPKLLDDPESSYGPTARYCLSYRDTIALVENIKAREKVAEVA